MVALTETDKVAGRAGAWVWEERDELRINVLRGSVYGASTRSRLVTTVIVTNTY